MFKYKDLITSAIKIVVHHKYLWFYGFFAVFLTNGILLQKIYSNNNTGFAQNFQKLKGTGIFDFGIINNIIQLAKTDPAGLALRMAVLLVIVALGLFVAWLAFVSQGALIKSVSDIYINKKSNFKTALKNGMNYFWPVFFFKIIEKTILLFLVATAGLTMFYSVIYENNFLIKISAIFLFLLSIIFIALVMLITRYAMSYSVINGRRFIDAVSLGFSLLKNNILMSIEMSLVILLINVILSFFALVLVSAAVIPFVFLISIFYKMAFLAGFTFILITGALSLFIIIGLVGAVLFVFNDSLWTIFFMNLSKETFVSRLHGFTQFFDKKTVS